MGRRLPSVLLAGALSGCSPSLDVPGSARISCDPDGDARCPGDLFCSRETSECIPAAFRSCGDGIVQDWERCDDGHRDACGTCDENCTGPGLGAECGDEVVCPELERCDDGYADACGRCNADCSGGGSGLREPDGSTICPEYRFTRIAGGTGHTCAIADNGSLWCWGDNSAGQFGDGTDVDSRLPRRSGDGYDWAAVGAGMTHPCGLTKDGRLWCWGGGGSGQLGSGGMDSTASPAEVRIMGPAGAVEDGHRWTSVSVAGWHSCGTRDDGTAWCWGFNTAHQVNPGLLERVPEPFRVGDAEFRSVPVRSVHTGRWHSCALREDDSLWCWGRNVDGQIADAPERVVTDPRRLDGSWSAAALGPYHTCGIRTDGQLWCWGMRESGRLGTGGTDEEGSAPAARVGDQTWRTLTAGGWFTCAIRTDGTLWCWGGNEAGAVGDGANEHRFVPTRVGAHDDWLGVWAGRYHACGIRADGGTHCWGSNSDDQLGLVRQDAPEPVRVAPPADGDGGGWTHVTCGDWHVCALRADRTAWCWGNNEVGQLGVGSQHDSYAPRQVGVNDTWTTISTHGLVTCGVREDETAWCWGTAESGALGDGRVDGTQIRPARIATPRRWRSVSPAKVHGCGLAADGALHCWGHNADGRVGDGSLEVRPRPVRVGEAEDWRLVVTGGFNSCAIDDGDALHCWGLAECGAVGDGRFGDCYAEKEEKLVASAPIEIGAGTAWRDVALGWTSGCAIAIDGGLSCWGQNEQGQLGFATSATPPVHPEPTRVGTDVDWRSLAAGGHHACAIKQDGGLWCWGSNRFGQLGNGSGETARTPARVGQENDWVNVAVGTNHTCGVRSDGSAWCWGYNFSGQVGNLGWRNRPQHIWGGAP